MSRRPKQYRPRSGYSGLILLLCFASIASTADEPSTEVAAAPPVQESGDVPVLDPAAIEARGAVIGKVIIRNNNIFDLSNPKDNKPLFRLANRLHIVTKPHVIEAQLLFEEGDRYSLRLADESERILRRNGYLREAEIKPVKFENGVVDLEVDTTDVWTLSPDLSLGRSGGENRFRIGLHEENLMGRGIQLGGAYRSNVDRDTLSFLYTDNNFLNDRYRLAANIAENSDGFFRRLEFGKPFYALDGRRAGRMTYSRGERIDQLYDRGKVVAEFNHKFEYHEASLGRSRGLRNGWTTRYSAGIAYTLQEFAEVPDNMLPVTIVPDDREYLYPFVAIQMIEDHFETTANFDQIHRTEDRFLGTSFSARLGYSSENAGSSGNAWHYRAGYNNTVVTTKKTSLTFGAGLNGRWENGSAQNAAVSGVMRFHRRITKHQLFYASLSGIASNNLDIDSPLYLGGDTGLRGYPLRYQNGESKALLTLEQRLFTDWYPFRLFHFGAVLFFDAGRTWGDSPVGTPNLGLLKDVGLGLRLGTSRSASGSVIHIDFAFPLDGEDDIDDLQILIDYKNSF